MKTLNTTLVVLCTLLHAAFSAAQAQAVYDNNYDTLYFGGANVTITNYPGTSNGTAQGDVVLYENVTILDGDTIDCYIITQSISSGVNISNFDKAATSGSTGSIIEDRFFAPQMTFPSGSASGPGGEVEFFFQFIEHGSFSYNSGTNTPSGTPVVLTNVRVNAYDIDGNANAYSNEYVQFKDFVFSELDENTTVAATYDHATSYTTFYSPTHLKNSDATDDRFRVVVNYDTLSSLDIHVLSGSTNYVFVDFGPGLPYTNNPIGYYRLNGTLHNDANGLTDDEVDGPMIDALDSDPVYMNLIESNTVIRSELVQDGGYFYFAAVPEGNYSIQTSTSKTAINTTNVDPSLPEAWVNTGEYLGTGVGSDGTVDGILSGITVDSSALSNIRLAVEKRPEADDHNTSISDPEWYDLLILGRSGTPLLSGSDLEDGALDVGSKMRVTAIPSLNRLTYNGVPVLLGDNGVTAPSATNPYTIDNYDSSKLGVLFMGVNTSSVSFNYQVVDAAGVYSDEATYTMSWSTPLPVKFLAVDAELTADKNVKINWSTAMELNNRLFEIERKFEGEDFYTPVGEVEGAGTSNDIRQYKFTDEIRQWNTNTVFYRLKQIDHNGAYSYSEEVAVLNRDVQNVELFPNPSVDHVNLSTDAMGAVKLRILAMNGAEVYAESFTKNTKINTSSLENGFYILQIISDRDIQTKRLQIVR